MKRKPRNSKISPFRNIPLIGAVFASASLALLVLLVPGIREAFSLTDMDRSHWITVLLLSLAPILTLDLFKLFKINGTENDK